MALKHKNELPVVCQKSTCVKGIALTDTISRVKYYTGVLILEKEKQYVF